MSCLSASQSHLLKMSVAQGWKVLASQKDEGFALFLVCVTVSRSFALSELHLSLLPLRQASRNRRVVTGGKGGANDKLAGRGVPQLYFQSGLPTCGVNLWTFLQQIRPHV